MSPTSSQTVKTHSKAGCFKVLSARIAIVKAAPAPSSAPKVVPFALTKPSSMYNCKESFSKSKLQSPFFSQTISI